MLDLIQFFWNVLRAFLGKPFVADPQSWMTQANRVYSEYEGVPMAQSVCSYFWRAVYLRPITRVTNFEPETVKTQSLTFLLTMAIGLASSYVMWMPRYPEMTTSGATLAGIALGVAVFVILNALLRFRVALLLIPVGIVLAIFLFINDWRTLLGSYAVVFAVILVGGIIFFVGTRFFCPRVSYNTEAVES